MTWSDFYLFCFIIGFGLSIVALVAGGVRLHVPHLHLPHGAHVPHLRAGTIRGNDLPWFNGGTLAAFLAWFGGAGYLLARYSAIWFVLVLAIAIMSGIGAAAIIFRFLKFLVDREAPLDPADYEMIGAFGRLSIPIRPGGTGELIYSQQGTRRVTGARSDDDCAIPKGAEVLVVRYEKGIAFVRPWHDLGAEPELK
jgi:membrane protein implicated in regulation of membrane protease activity